jgi:hypothetical protein
VPQYQNYAFCQDMAVNSHLWRGLTNAWIPGLGNTGRHLPDLGGQHRHAYASDPTPDSAWERGDLGWALDGQGDINRYWRLGAQGWDIRAVRYELTIAIWARIDVFSPGDQRIISKASSSSEADHIWMISAYDSNPYESFRSRIKIGATTRTVLGNSNIITTGEWHLCVARVSVENGLQYSRVFIDGEDVSNPAYQGSAALLSTSYTSYDAELHRNPGGIPYGPMDGATGPAMIWNRALTQSELYQLAQDPYALVRPVKRNFVTVAAPVLFPPWPKRENTLLRR